MSAIRKLRTGMAVLASAGLLAGISLAAAPCLAQRTAQTVAAEKGRSNSPYDPAREVSVEGSVTKFTENSALAPPGAHVLVQTASGPVDVHLGDARLLKLHMMTIAEGARIRVIGEYVTTNAGTFFLARLLQQGTQVVAVRSMQGMMLWPAAVRANPELAKNLTQGGAR
jgi:hypothetical protein